MDRAFPDSRTLVRRALSGDGIPSPPVGPLAVHFCARFAGVSLRAYTTDASALADCVARYHARFRPDAVWVSADTWVTAQAMGAETAFPGEDQPMSGTGRPLVRTRPDIDRIAPPDPSSQGRWPLMVEALRRVRSAVGPGTFVVACFDQYPFSLACAALGVERAMLALEDDRPLVEALLERCGEYAVAYGRALAAAGADMLSGGDSPAVLLGPRRYREIALPHERRVIAELKAAAGLPVSLHICGDATRLLAGMAESGADVLELDHGVDLAAAFDAVGPGVAVWGNLDPVGLLARGTPEGVRAAARAALDAARRRRFVLSSGCALALETPPENLDALREAARAH